MNKQTVKISVNRHNGIVTVDGKIVHSYLQQSPAERARLAEESARYQAEHFARDGRHVTGNF